jgi:hypothetical protein
MLSLLALTACNNEEDMGREGPGPAVIRPTPEGEARTVALGFSSLSPRQTTESYISAFANAALHADAILIQRRPPWGDFMPGGSVSRETADTTLLETRLLQQYSSLKLFYAIDPTDGAVQRSRVADLPPGVDAAAGFNDPSLRAAFVAYVTYVAANYRPDYMAIGVEINMLYERSRPQFEAFLSLYREAYAAVRQASPATRIFPTFQLEDLQGLLGDVHPPHWQVIDEFAGLMDVLAISTYPFVAFDDTHRIPADYVTQLRAHFDGEIIISETGYPSAPIEGYAVAGSQEDQAAYLERLLADAEAAGVSTVFWLAAFDPEFAGTGSAAIFRDTGLRMSGGAPKLAWALWESWARRPLRRPG